MAIPGLKKPDHIGFTVPNLNQAIAFFREHFDFELAYEFGPFASDDDWMTQHLNVDARAQITKIAVMSAKGIKVLGEPSVMTNGPTAGESWVYFMSPWGMQLELVSYPNGKAYQRNSSVALFDPR